MSTKDTRSTTQPPSTPVANVIPATFPSSPDRSKSPLLQTPVTPTRRPCSRLSQLPQDALFASCGLAYFSPSTEAERVAWELHGGKGDDGEIYQDPFPAAHRGKAPCHAQTDDSLCQAAFVDPVADDSLILSLARHPISLYRAGWVDDCVAAGELLALEPYTISKVVILERTPRKGQHHALSTPSPLSESVKAEPLKHVLLSPFRGETPTSPTPDRRRPKPEKSPKLQGFKPRLSYVDSPTAAARLTRWHQESSLSPRSGYPSSPL